MNILNINDLALELVARDFSNGHSPTNGGPTKTSRALAIIHLAAHDAFMQLDMAAGTPINPSLPPPPASASISIGVNEATDALVGAGIQACKLLYPDDTPFITSEASKFLKAYNPTALWYGEQVANHWVDSRKNDGSSAPQTDSLYDESPGRHRPDPLNPTQPTLGRTWGQVAPFILKNVALDAPLGPPPALDSQSYADAFDEVIERGKWSIPYGSDSDRENAVTGVYWGYDGANLLGTPPRLYNQVVRATLDFQNATPVQQIKLLAAINAAMADAGIAAWYWKYQYDLWRPVVGIREAGLGFGPTGQGDGNILRTMQGDPFWRPLGAPKSNPYPAPSAGASGDNGTPNFPAYPSGHATFGAACFETVMRMLDKQPTVTFVSDEFNGKTTDNTGAARPRIEKTFTYNEAIAANNISRIYLGVHWVFDATGGEELGRAIARCVALHFN